MLSKAGSFLRSKASSQSQESHDHSTISCHPTSLADSKTSAYAQTKGMHHKSSHSSTSKVTSMRERDLSRALLEKELEIEELRTDYEGKVSRREHEIQNLRHGLTIFRESSNKDRDMLTFLEGFQVMLDEKGEEMEELRAYYTRVLHAQERQQKNSKTLQRNADAEAEALREKLMTIEQELELCRDDLFRMQPVCRISDGNIIAAFESLGEQVVNWIDNETSALENAYPGMPIGWLFSGSKDSNAVSFSKMHPLAGEYLCRHMVNRCLVEHMFGTTIHRWGLSAEVTRMQLDIEQGMAALEPPRDSQTLNIWRAETLSALGATQEYQDIRERQSIHWTTKLFENLSASCPNIFRTEEAMKRFHDQVTIPATTIVSQLQELASPYRLSMAKRNILDGERFTKNDLSRLTAIDWETGKTLKPGSVIVSDRDGVIGDFVLPLEPSLHRVNEGTNETDLRKETWLVRLDHPLGSRVPKGD